MKCIYCKHPYTYLLSDKQQKCSKCKRKFSPQKIARRAKLFQAFKEGKTARETSLDTKMHFATVQKYYEEFRRELALYADAQYQQNIEKVTGYDEYLYLPKSLKIEKNIEKIQHFLTLSYENKVYNLMMPKQKVSILYDQEDKDHKILLKYLTFNKIRKLSKAQSTITSFWEYFELFICKYKGVSSEQFIFYLKEAEWRFNHHL